MYGLIVISVLIIALLAYWTIYRPFTFYLFYKKQNHTLAEFVPIFSTFSRSKNYVDNHHDYYYGILQQKRKNPNLKVVGRNIGSTYMLYILDHVLVQQMFTASDKLIIKHQFQNSFIKTLSPRGLVLSEGKTWKKHRKIFAQGFAYQKIQVYLKNIYDSAQQRMKLLEHGSVINTMPYFKKAAGGILSKSFFGFDVNEIQIDGVCFPLYLSSLISDLSCEAYGYIFSLLGMVLVKMKIFDSLNCLEKRIEKTRSAIRKVVRQQKAMRVNSEVKQKNMWDFFFENQDPLDEDQVIDQFITFFSDGVYTSGHFMMMFCYYLAVNPQWQQKIRQELKDATEQSFLKQNSLNNLKVVRACMWQTFRLAPPVVTGIERIVLRDTKLAKQYPLKKDTMVMACQIVNHLDPTYHDNPRKFDPERWLTDSKTLEWSKKFPGIFMPFSIGARNCPGQHFAKSEATIFLSLLLKKYQISLKNKDYVMKFCQKFLRQPQISFEIVLDEVK